MATAILVGAGVTCIALVSRAVFRTIQRAGVSNPLTTSKYLVGGFQSDMNLNEAQLILGINGKYTKETLKKQHRQIMLMNHPDRGGSPFVATKINQAKDMLDKHL